MNVILNLLKMTGSWLWARAGERSTWLGVITAATAAGANFNPEVAEHIVNAGVAVVSVIAVVTRDKKN